MKQSLVNLVTALKDDSPNVAVPKIIFHTDYVKLNEKGRVVNREMRQEFMINRPFENGQTKTEICSIFS